MSSTQRTHWPAVAATLTAGVVAAGYVGKMPPALPLFQEELGLSLIAVSWLVSMFNLIGLSAALPFGLSADRLGSFRFCILGLAVLAAGGLAGSVADSAAWMLASRVLEGSGFIAVAVSGPALLVAASAPARRSLTLGLWSAYLPFGVCVGLALSPFAIAAVGWRGWWVLLAGATLACMAALAAFRRHYTGVRRAQPRTAADLRRALGQPAPWLYGTAFAAYTVSFHGVVVWVPTYVQQTQNAGLAQGSLLAAAMMLANVGGNLYGARLAQRGVPRGRIMTAAFLLGGLIAVGIYAPGVAPAARYACALLFNLVVGVIPAAVMSGVPRYAGSAAEVATLQGVVVQLSNVGIFGGPPLVAVAVTWGGGWEATIVVLLAAAAAGAALSVWLARFERRVLPAAV